MNELQRGTGHAAWRQIADLIERDIADGRLRPQEKLASEAELADRFNVNRHTVRRALAALREQGFVSARQGQGTFVEDSRLPYPIGRKTRFSDIVSKAGREASGELVASSEMTADPHVAEALDLETGAPVLELVTVHRADGTPISTARAYFPLPRFAGFNRSYKEAKSITRAFGHYGVDDYTRLSTTITAGLAGPRESALLELPPGRVVLVVDSINIDSERRPIQWTRAYFASDRVELVVQ